MCQSLRIAGMRGYPVYYVYPLCFDHGTHGATFPQEAWQLNPHGPVAYALPGEVFVSVGQNPKVPGSFWHFFPSSIFLYQVIQMIQVLKHVWGFQDSTAEHLPEVFQKRVDPNDGIAIIVTG